MNLSETIKSLCAELGVSVAELARRSGQSSQNLHKKLKNETLAFEEFKSLLELLGVKLEMKVLCPGEKVDHERRLAIVNELTADYEEVEYVVLNLNKSRDVAQIFRQGEILPGLIPGWTEEYSFHNRLDLMADNFVCRQDRARFISQTRRELILSGIESSSAYYVRFKAVIEDNLRYWQLKFSADRDEEGNVVGFICGIADVDARTREALARERHIEEKINDRTLELQEKNRSLSKINEEIITFIGNVVEARDMESGEHIERVKVLSYILGKTVMELCPEYGLTPERVKIISAASALHDVGKIMISDGILLKPDKLTPEEFELMKTHCVKGCELLKKAPVDWNREYLETGMEICRWHHEKWDGRGYPDGLKGDQIPISAQIVSVADVFDALVSKRIYKGAYSASIAYRMIMSGECGEFSEKMKTCLSMCKDEFERFALNPYSMISAESISAQTLKESLKGLTILVAEDNEINREITRELLVNEGANVIETEDGKECLEVFLDSEPGSISAVLMDLEMPKMNGIEATRRIRAVTRADSATIPIIAMTAETSGQVLEEAVNAGMNDYLTKPVPISQLSKVLLDIMQKQNEQLKSELSVANLRANRDALTGILNKNAYNEMTESIQKRISSGICEEFAIVMLDIDNLKHVNDSFGHGYGDRYIINACAHLCETFRNSAVYRIGGDEFVAVLTGRDYAKKFLLMEELRNRSAGFVNEATIESGAASFSAGLAVYDPEIDRTVQSVFVRADGLMYEEKKQKK